VRFIRFVMRVCAHTYASTAQFGRGSIARRGFWHAFFDGTIVRMGEYEIGYYGWARAGSGTKSGAEKPHPSHTSRRMGHPEIQETGKKPIENFSEDELGVRR